MYGLMDLMLKPTKNNVFIVRQADLGRFVNEIAITK